MNRPAAVEITYGCMRFLITHNPTNATLNKFTEVCAHVRAAQSEPHAQCVHFFSLVCCQELKKFHVNTLVRVCDATYDKAPVEKEGIQVLVSGRFQFFFYIAFPSFLEHRTPHGRISAQDWPFDDGGPPPTEIVDDWLKLLNTKFREEPGCCVAVHCVAGLGR